MKALLLCLVVAGATAANVLHLQQSTWNDLQRAKLVEEINKHPGVLWKAGISERFSGTPLGSEKSMLGVKPTNAADLQKRIESGRIKRAVLKPNLKLPDSFDSATNWPRCAKVINDIRDQSNCGCCWAFAAAEAASDRMCINSNGTMQMPLSAQDNCFNAESDGCDGGQLGTAWDYIQQSGLVTGGQFNGTGPFGSGWCSAFSLPHCHHHGPQRNDPYPPEGSPGCPSQSSPDGPSSCDSSATSPHSNFNSDKYTFNTGDVESASGEAEIMQAIYEGGPVETAFTVYADFANYAGGIYHYVSGAQLGGHAVKFVGWGQQNGVKYWKVANSWNPYWGEQGYFRIRKGTDECGIEDGVVYSSASAQWGKKN